MEGGNREWVTLGVVCNTHNIAQKDTLPFVYLKNTCQVYNLLLELFTFLETWYKVNDKWKAEGP